jgi:hypothetical protein
MKLPVYLLMVIPVFVVGIVLPQLVVKILLVLLLPIQIHATAMDHVNGILIVDRMSSVLMAMNIPVTLLRVVDGVSSFVVIICTLL